MPHKKAPADGNPRGMAETGKDDFAMANVARKAFTDTSIFHGVVEFESDSGEELRFTRESGRIWARYVKRGNAYVFNGRVALKNGKRATPRNLWACETD